MSFPSQMFKVREVYLYVHFECIDKKPSLDTELKLEKSRLWEGKILQLACRAVRLGTAHHRPVAQLLKWFYLSRL